MSKHPKINGEVEPCNDHAPMQIKIEASSSDVKNIMSSSGKRSSTTATMIGMDTASGKRSRLQQINDESIPETATSAVKAEYSGVSVHLDENHESIQPQPAPVQSSQSVTIKLEHEEGASIHPIQSTFPLQHDSISTAESTAHSLDTFEELALHQDVMIEESLPEYETETEQSKARSTAVNKDSLIDIIQNHIQDFQDGKVVGTSNDKVASLPIYHEISSRNVIILSSYEASNKAVSDIRTEVALVKQNLKHEGPNHPIRMFQFIGFDTETTITRNNITPVLIQLATFSTTYLFRLKYDDMEKNDSAMTPSLRSLLCDPNIIKIGMRKQSGLNVNRTIRELNIVYGNCCGNGDSYVDISRLVKHRWPNADDPGKGKRQLVSAVLHCRLPKTKNKDWEIRDLTPAMREHAAANASVVLDLFMAMLVKPITSSQHTQPSEVNVFMTEDTLNCKRHPVLEMSSLFDLIKEHDAKSVIEIPPNEIINLPQYAHVSNRIVVITSAAASNQAVLDIRNELMAGQRRNQNVADPRFKLYQFVGFDTETRPKFCKGGDVHPTALLQIATATTCYLFRIKYESMNERDSPMTGTLRCLLSDRSIIKVGVGIHADARALNREYGSDCCGDGKSYLDIMPLAKLRWPKIQRFGLRNLTATVLRSSLSKAQQMKNWEMHTMTPAMEKYAAADAFVALDLLAAIVPFGGYCIRV